MVADRLQISPGQFFGVRPPPFFVHTRTAYRIHQIPKSLGLTTSRIKHAQLEEPVAGQIPW